MIVLDANIPIRAVLGTRVRELIDTYAAQGVRFFVPDVAFPDAEKYVPPLLKKRGKADDLAGALGYLRESSSRLVLMFMPSLKAKLDCACAVATKLTGPYWLVLSDSLAASGRRMPISLEPVSQSGPQIASRSSSRDRQLQRNLKKNSSARSLIEKAVAYMASKGLRND